MITKNCMPGYAAPTAVAIAFLAFTLAVALAPAVLHWIVLTALVITATWLYAIRRQRPTPRFWFLLVMWTFAAIACATPRILPFPAIAATLCLAAIHTGIHYGKPWAWWTARIFIWTVCTGFAVWAIVITADRLTPLPANFDLFTEAAFDLMPLFIGAAYFSSAAIIAWQTFNPTERQRVADAGLSPYWKVPGDDAVAKTAEPQS